MADLLTNRAYEALVTAQDAKIAELEATVQKQRRWLSAAHTRMSNVVTLIESSNPTIATHDYVLYAKEWVGEYNRGDFRC
jgi:cellobiose-specific phosphotransferase system component IIA